MPLFVCISGYLYQAKLQDGQYVKFLPFLKNKFQRLIIPYLFWGALQLIIFRDTTDFPMVITGVLHLWFLLMMFMVFNIAWSLHRWSSNNTFLIILLTFTIVIDSLTSWTNIFCIGAVIHYLPFFLLGMLLSKSGKRGKTIIVSIITLLSSTGMLALLTCWNNSPSFQSISILNSICIILILISLFNLTDTLSVFKSLSEKTIIQSINKNSYGIYIIHHILIWGTIQISFVKTVLDSNTYIPPLILFLTSFVLSWFASQLLRRNKYTKILFGDFKK